MKKKLISVVIPICNEEKNIPLIYNALKEEWAELPLYDYEFLFVNDGSSDGSAGVVDALALWDMNVKYIEFSRNFGKEMATTAGIEAAGGDAIIMIDADLQHPPRLIPEFISRWENGAEVVVGVRTRNHGEGTAKKVGSWLFYRIMRLMSETPIERGETDFRLIDRAVADAFKNFREQRRMTRALINWLGFRKDVVYFEADARAEGSAQYGIGKLLHLALYALVSDSLLPLQFAGYLGVIITACSSVLGLVVFTERYIFNDAWGWHISGSAQLAIINVFLIGIVLMALGIIALYIANIHVEVANRPLYVVRKRSNF